MPQITVTRWIVALLLMLFLAACGGSTPDPTAAPLATTATDDPVAEATVEPTVAAPIDASAEADTEDMAEEDDAHEHGDDTHTHSDVVNLTYFLDGALAEAPTVVDCTLTDGTATQCYELTVVGTPVNHDVGPFCPTSITDSADAGGLWLDGENSYEIDGPFFTELADIYGDELWNNIYNEDGSVNVIDNAEDFQVAARPDITEEYYYHCVDGDVAWVGDGVQPTTTIQVPITPTQTDGPTIEFAEGGHSNLGVTFNGAALSGSADMTAILASYTIAAFDDCGGHINPALGYHVHGTAGCSDVGEAIVEGETAPFALAVDGHTVHAPYDDDAAVELDECNGHTSEAYGYHYHANSLEENGTLTCLTGLTAEGQGGGPGGGGPGGGRGEGGGGQGGGQGGGPPDFAAVAVTLGVSEDALRDALGDPPPDVEAAATVLGVSAEALQAALDGGGAPESAAPAEPAETVDTDTSGDTGVVGTTIGTLVASEFYGEYMISDEAFGTNVQVTISDNERVMFTNSLPPWPADEFPEGNNSDISEQDRTYTFALNPVYTGSASRERSTGVSVTGIKFDAGTAQQARCENGVSYNIEAVNTLIPFGIDVNNAHVQNDGTYHYHNVPVSELSGSELQHVGFALDGFLIYYSPTNEHPSSFQLRTEDREGVNCTYSEPDLAEISFSSTPDGTFQQDYEFIEGSGALDTCNGAVVNGEYAYFVTDAYPHIPRCLNGEVAGGDAGGGGAGGGAGPGGGAGGAGGGAGGAGGGGAGGGQAGGLDFPTAAEMLGVTEEALRDAVGGPPPEFAAAAEALGISEEDIRAAFGE